MTAPREPLIEHLRTLLAAQPDVDAAWLCGSRARRQARPRSDVDVLVLFSAGLAAGGEAASFRRGRLADDLAGALGLPVDVLDLERIGPAVLATAFPGARLLLDRAPARRIDALARQYARWHDAQSDRALRRESLRSFFTPRGDG